MSLAAYFASRAWYLFKSVEFSSTGKVIASQFERNLQCEKEFLSTDALRMAKAKRERLRQAHLAPDYLPLGGASSLLSQDFKHKDMAKNSDSEEEVEEGMRMKFIGGSTKSKYVPFVHSGTAQYLAYSMLIPRETIPPLCMFHWELHTFFWS